MFSNTQKWTLFTASAVITGALLIGVAAPTNTVAGEAVAAPATATTADGSYDDDGSYDGSADGGDGTDYPTEEPVTPTDLYLELVGAEVPTASDPELLDAASRVCEVLGDTYDPNQDTLLGIGLGLVDIYGWTLPQTGAVVGGAIAAFCPEFSAVPNTP